MNVFPPQSNAICAELFVKARPDSPLREIQKVRGGGGGGRNHRWIKPMWMETQVCG